MLELPQISTLQPRQRLILCVRHAERDEKTPDRVSAVGIAETIVFAKRLNEMPLPIKIFSSPETRCLETANIISRILRIQLPVESSTFLGRPGAQIKNQDAYAKLYAKLRCREIYTHWKAGRYYDALEEPELLCKKTLQFFENSSLADSLTLYISQSGTVAGMAYATGARNFEVEKGEWVNNLDGFILVLQD